MSYTLRAATTADLEGVTGVFLACWQENYRGVLPADAIAAMSEDRAHKLWLRVLNASEGEVLVAERLIPQEPGADGKIELLGMSRFAITQSAIGGVYSLYVSPNAQGLGVGSHLLTAASERLSTLGAQEATLWVFAANAPAIAFYRKNGWLPDGGKRTQSEFGETELRLHRSLPGAPW